VRLFNRSTAYLISAFYAVYVIAHGSGGWDYHNTAAGPFYIFCYLALVDASSSTLRPIANFFVVGVLLALTLHTNILFVNVAPALFIQFLYQRSCLTPSSRSRSWDLSAVGATLIGACCCTLVLGLINAADGRDFFFSRKLLEISTNLIENPGRE